MAFEETGVSLVAEGSDAFEGALDSAASSVGGFHGAIDAASSAISPASEMIVGALRHVGEVAVDALMSAGAAVGQFVSDSFDGALAAEDSMARIAQVIKSTGGQAGLTVADVAALGAEFSTLAGGTDDTVLAIEEMGLRMGNVSKEQMPNFIQTTLDLAAATGVDAVSGARLMAQAYDDPLGVMGRLQKQGILFSDDLRTQAKEMVDSGDVAGAYALVMGRVGEATSGAAAAGLETVSGKMNLFKNILNEAGEGILSAFLPALSSIFDTVIAPNLPLIEQLAGDVGGMVTAFLSANDPISIAQGALASLSQTFAPIIDSALGLGAAFDNSMPEIMGAAQMMSDFLMGLFGTLGPALIANVSSFLDSMAAFWDAHGTAIIATVTVAFEVISTVVAVTLALISGGIAQFGNIINGDTEGFMATLQGTFESVMNAILSLVGQDLDTFIGNWTGVLDLALAIADAVWSGIENAISGAVAGILGVLLNVIGGIQDFIDAILDIPPLPDWITPGSPTPFELGLRGIADAMRQVNSIAPSFMDSVSAPASATGVTNSVINNNVTHAPQYNLGVSTRESSQSVIGNFAVMQALAG